MIAWRFAYYAALEVQGSLALNIIATNLVRTFSGHETQQLKLVIASSWSPVSIVW